MKILNKLHFILLYILGFVIIGITSVITGNIGFSAFQEPMFYIKQLLTDVAIICVTIATVLFVVDRFTKTDEEYKASEKTIKDFAENIYIPSIFNRFVEKLNWQRKKKQHVYNVRKQLHKLEVIAEIKEKHLNKKGKQQSYFNLPQYTNTKAKLEKQLEDEYIEKELPMKIITYDRITVGVILSGYYTKSDNSSVNEFVTKGKTAKIIRDKVPHLLISFAVTLLTSSLLIDFKFNAQALLDIVVKIGVLVWNTFTAYRYANNYTQTVALKDIRFRKGIIKEYEKWIIQEAEKKKEETTTLTEPLREDELINTQENKFRTLTEGVQKQEKLINEEVISNESKSELT